MEVFIQLAIILFAAFLVSYIVKLFRQPIVIGYIVAGMLISPIIVGSGASNEMIHIFSQFGIALLLFIVGLHLNPKVIREIGTPSLFIGLFQILLTFGFTFLLATKILGFNTITAAYIGIALTFSSTIIIMKLLSDKGNLDSLYGKIAIGILIVQDFVAIFVLMFITSLGGGINFTSFAIRSLLIGGGLILALALFGIFVLPRFIRSVAKSQELLFLFSICWCFIIAALFAYFGFSIEIGALLAGMVLSISPYSIEISAKVRSLRDFFLIIFFIILGLGIQFQNLGSIIGNALIFSLVVLLFKPLVLMIFMTLFGYTKRTNFLVGSTLAQISEFSLIILTLGVAMGHISGEVLSTLTLTGILTITISTYGIIYSRNIYKKISSLLFLFERKNSRKKRVVHKTYDAMLFGYNRIGFGILRSLKKIRQNYLVIDFNPDTIASLTKARMPCLYGDAFDPDFIEDLPLNKLKLAVSTIPDLDSNLLLIESIRNVNSNAIIIVRAHQIQDALELYQKGASYVLTPHFLGGEYISKMIKELKTSEDKYKDEKIKHIKLLKDMMKKGHEHPKE